MLRYSRTRAIFLLGFVSISQSGIAKESEPKPLASWPIPLPSVQTFAATHLISLSGFSKIEIRRSHIHDKATILISFGEGEILKQWLVEIEAVELSTEEQKHQDPEIPLYVSTGTKLIFKTRPLALILETHGPFSASPQKEEAVSRSSRIIVNEENLMLGFDQACQACIRIIALKHARGENGTIGLSFRGSPFNAAENVTSKMIAREVGLTLPEERAMAGSVPALSSFFDVAQGASALKEVLLRVVDLPSAWSLLKRGGKLDTKFLLNAQKIASIELGNVPGDTFVLPITLEINGRPSLECSLWVGPPHPPFLLTAGIFGIIAQAPSKTAQRATLQLLSATCSPESSR